MQCRNLGRGDLSFEAVAEVGAHVVDDVGDLGVGQPGRPKEEFEVLDMPERGHVAAAVEDGRGDEVGRGQGRVAGQGRVMTRALRAAIDDRTLRRTYRCVVAGVPAEPEGMITSMLLRDGGQGRRGSRRGTLKVRPANRPDPGPMPGSGQLAITRYSVCKHTPERAALEVRLSTGRTHQIRIHLAEMGHPVLGERVYARPGGASRQALHAAKLCVPHPETGELLFFESRWPADLATVNPIGDDW